MALRLLSLRAAAMLLAAASTVACSKKEDAAVATPAVTYGVAFTVNGVAATVPVFKGGSSGNKAYVTASTGTTTASNSIVLNMPKRVGSYNLATDTVATASYDEGGTVLYTADSGTITVTALSATDMAGTFNFVATPIVGTGTRTITNGTFTTKFE